jgi:hypothetical protein
VILVGGGSVLVDVTKTLQGASAVMKPEHFEVCDVKWDFWFVRTRLRIMGGRSPVKMIGQLDFSLVKIYF